MTDPELDHYGLGNILVAGMRVLDIGASVGRFASPAMRLGCEVLAVEPRRGNVLRLEAHGVLTLRAAVGAHDGIGWFCEAEPPAHETGGFVVSERVGLMPVPVLSLSSLVVAWRPHVVKLDIEGGEYEALSSFGSLAAAMVPCFTIDTHEWTVGDEQRREGVGHREAGPRYDPESFSRLLWMLSQWYDVRCLGPERPGVTVVATR